MRSKFNNRTKKNKTGNIGQTSPTAFGNNMAPKYFRITSKNISNQKLNDFSKGNNDPKNESVNNKELDASDIKIKKWPFIKKDYMSLLQKSNLMRDDMKIPIFKNKELVCMDDSNMTKKNGFFTSLDKSLNKFLKTEGNMSTNFSNCNDYNENLMQDIKPIIKAQSRIIKHILTTEYDVATTTKPLAKSASNWRISSKSKIDFRQINVQTINRHVPSQVDTEVVTKLEGFQKDNEQAIKNFKSFGNMYYKASFFNRGINQKGENLFSATHRGSDKPPKLLQGVISKQETEAYLLSKNIKSQNDLNLFKKIQINNNEDISPTKKIKLVNELKSLVKNPSLHTNKNPMEVDFAKKIDEQNMSPRSLLPDKGQSQRTISLDKPNQKKMNNLSTRRIFKKDHVYVSQRNCQKDDYMNLLKFGSVFAKLPKGVFENTKSFDEFYFKIFIERYLETDADFENFKQQIFEENFDLKYDESYEMGESVMKNIAMTNQTESNRAQTPLRALKKTARLTEYFKAFLLKNKRNNHKADKENLQARVQELLEEVPSQKRSDIIKRLGLDGLKKNKIYLRRDHLVSDGNKSQIKKASNRERNSKESLWLEQKKDEELENMSYFSKNLLFQKFNAKKYWNVLSEGSINSEISIETTTFKIYSIPSSRKVINLEDIENSFNKNRRSSDKENFFRSKSEKNLTTHQKRKLPDTELDLTFDEITLLKLNKIIYNCKRLLEIAGAFLISKFPQKSKKNKRMAKIISSRTLVMKPIKKLPRDIFSVRPSYIHGDNNYKSYWMEKIDVLLEVENLEEINETFEIGYFCCFKFKYQKIIEKDYQPLPEDDIENRTLQKSLFNLNEKTKFDCENDHQKVYKKHTFIDDITDNEELFDSMVIDMRINTQQYKIKTSQCS